MIQLAVNFTKLNVIATASRPDTIEWCRKMGVHHIIDHISSVNACVGRAEPDSALAEVNSTGAGRRTEIFDPEVVHSADSGGEAL